MLCLSAHPDKQATVDAKEAKQVQEKFVQIQEAYELLSDSTKRMQYDSSLDFDDSLPKFRPQDGEDFYEVFSEVFRRNARFATRRPVPDIGTAEARIEDVKKFYNYWYEFQSWRDPVVLAQQDGEEICDLAEAECREERRWMVRENARVARAYKQAERDRIASLIAMAEKFDPRLLAEKEAKKEARRLEGVRRDEERNALQRLKDEEDRKRREAEEAEREVEEQKRKAEKAVREAVKDRLKKCRQRLRSFFPALKEGVVIEQVNEICLQLEESALKQLGDQVEAALKKGASDAIAVVHRAIESLGLKPIMPKLDDDAASTSSGPAQSSSPSEEQSPEDAKLRKDEERIKAERAAANKARLAAEEVEQAQERARVAVEKAEEKKKREELKRKEQAATEVKKRQAEKKDDGKAKKAEDKAKKQVEQDEQKRIQQREDAKTRSIEQADRDRAAAQTAKEEQDQERQVQMFSADRLERLAKLEPLTDADILASLRTAVDEDKTLSASLKFMQNTAAAAGAELALDRFMALVYTLSPVWPLGLAAPAAIKLPNAIRNRVKKARTRLRDAVTSFLQSAKLDGTDESLVSDWHRGIIDGSIEPPVWTPEEREAEAKAEAEAKLRRAQQDAPATQPSLKKGKAKGAKEPAAEEDLDQLLAEFGMAPPNAKKGGKKKK